MDKIINNLVYILVGFAIGTITYLLIYFFYIVPDLKETIDELYPDASVGIVDTVIKTIPVIKYRDTSLTSREEVGVNENASSGLTTFVTSFDSTIVSGKDTLEIVPTVKIEFSDSMSNDFYRSITAEWFVRLIHKDYQQIPDTIKIRYPEYIDRVEKEINWMVTGIAFVSAIIMSIILVLAG